MIYFLLGFFICFSLLSILFIFIYLKGFLKLSNNKETLKELEKAISKQNENIDTEFWGNLNCSKYLKK